MTTASARVRPISAVLATRASAVMLAALWIGALVFVALLLDRGWVAHDEGSFAQSAQRVLDGEVPHRDFTELYTGGLTFLNAAIFGLFGENLLWLRVPMFVLFAAFVPCVYLLARRFAGRAGSALVALLAVSWGLPLYPAAVPSWYLLFFAVFGAAALMRYLDTGRDRWLVAAGVFGGLSVGFKVVGVWYVAAALLFLIFVEQESRPRAAGRRPVTVYEVLVAAASVTFLAAILAVLRSRIDGPELFNFVLPVGAVCALVVLNERQVTADVDLWARLRSVVRLAAPFLLGVAGPLVALMVPFAVTGSLDDLFRGVFITPQSRLDYSYTSTITGKEAIRILPLLAYVIVRGRVPLRTRRIADAVFAVAWFALFVTALNDFSYRWLFLSARAAAPLIVVLGVVVLAMAARRRSGYADRRPALLLLALAAFLSLVQFPFGTPIYFAYSVPLFALAALASFAYSGTSGGLLPVALLATYVAVGFVWLDHGPLYTLGVGVPGSYETVTLDPSRAAIRVVPDDRREWMRAVELLKTHSSSPYTYAGPDAPELYYLSGLSNPTPSLFAFLDRSGSERAEHLIPTLRERQVTAIAIHVNPFFSDPLDPRTTRALNALYPHHERVGGFDVRWCLPECRGGLARST